MLSPMAPVLRSPLSLTKGQSKDQPRAGWRRKVNLCYVKSTIYFFFTFKPRQTSLLSTLMIYSKSGFSSAFFLISSLFILTPCWLFIIINSTTRGCKQERCLTPGRSFGKR